MATGASPHISSTAVLSEAAQVWLFLEQASVSQLTVHTPQMQALSLPHSASSPQRRSQLASLPRRGELASSVVPSLEQARGLPPNKRARRQAMG